ncbi:NifU family protein [Clostridium sardiniense]|uniref:NifU family protein n=1 Tax=Clostridium sardiniense TaxID=29369 RepID=A0ABS7KX36_CLOSR|nr:NifU family protein [Clostridium sardiniense]MBY0755247.1 NifU family protein [Clostridium sardiniense]MDQ0459690.1 Fe-S cluster biogenesis protein NfuA [Clostridium sardiniense]
MYNRVNSIINEKVRPALKEHNGDIELVDVKDGVVTVKLLGQCSGCPSAKFTLEHVVQTTLQNEVPEIKEVIATHEVSEELLDMARKILSKNK